MALDTTQGQAITRLTGTLQQLADYEGFSRAETRYYVRIATAIATGLIPYINGRDDILQRQIDELFRRVRTLEDIAENHEQRITSLEQRFSSIAAQAASFANQANASRISTGTIANQIRRVSGITQPQQIVEERPLPDEEGFQPLFDEDGNPI